MSHLDWLIEYVVIAAACASVDIYFRWLDRRRNKKLEEIKKLVEEKLCDSCRKPRRKLISTTDQKLWLCRTCTKVYKLE